MNFSFQNFFHFENFSIFFFFWKFISWKKNIYKSFFSKNLSLKIFFFAKKFLSWIIFLCKILFENSTSKKIIKVFTNDFFSKTFLHFFFFENSTLKIKNIHKRLFLKNSFPWKSFSLQNISFLELFFFAKDFFWKFRSFKNIYKRFFFWKKFLLCLDRKSVV